LRALETEYVARIEQEKQNSERVAVRLKLTALAKEHGFDIHELIGKGRKVRVHDPHIQLGEIYGSNQRYIMNAIPHIGNLLDDRLETMLDWADHVLVAQKPSASVLAKLEAARILAWMINPLRSLASPAVLSPRTIDIRLGIPMAARTMMMSVTIKTSTRENP